MKKLSAKNEQGSIIVTILLITILLTTFIFGLIVLANANLTRARQRIFLLQSQYAAESGVDAAIAQFNNGNDTYTGTPSDVQILDNPRYRSTYTVSVATGADAKEKIVTATGKVYVPKTAATPNFTRRIEVVVQRSSTSTSSSMLSRNIIETGSNVKDIKAKDIYVNGYINLTDTQNRLIAENITVADKNTGAGNCSIGGTGKVIKPSSFSTPGQTKTNITMAFNNCITPTNGPGNTSNVDFDVLANQTTVGKVQSTYIPLSHVMLGYQSSPGGCSDWTTGSSPRSIPIAGNTNKTHYPDSSSNIATSCGSSGDLALGSNQYDIKDHVHVRANFCASSACSPTFYNPDAGAAGLKYVFIEGSVNFNKVTTASGSGPIVFVVYGADPASKVSLCPYGGAFYLGNDKTVAPALFVLAMNGICLDKTKFDANPGFGGLSGKNLYIHVNSGSPHDLQLDVSFPTSEIPVDLAWRAVRYRRLLQ